MKTKRTPEPVKVYGNRAMVTGTEFTVLLEDISLISSKLNSLTENVQSQGSEILNMEQTMSNKFEQLDKSIAELKESVKILAQAMTTYIGGQ